MFGPRGMTVKMPDHRHKRAESPGHPRFRALYGRSVRTKVLGMPEVRPRLPEGLVAVVKRDCPTCQLVARVLGEIAGRGRTLTVYTQDDPGFPATVPARIHDQGLAVSWHH